ncbi:MAG: TPM domain-containing protein, partial [Clostridiales bacterium]|nr:TPM domain-containing protein [Clostridiales bacterium]
REWAISTYGYGITAFTDAGQSYMTDQFLPFLSDGDYYQAFDTFASLCDEFLTQAKSGEPYDSGNLPKGTLSLLWIPVSLLIGALLALIPVSVMKSKLKSVRSQPQAGSYIKSGSMKITDSTELFLYRNVTRREKPTNTSSRSRGSSTHVSSSGRSHGGSSGRF